MIVFKNGMLVDAHKSVKADIAVDQGMIVAMGKDLTGPEVIDVSGKVIMPAFIDTHAHFRDPGFTHKEDLESGSKAALKGGFATVNLMANTNPVVDTVEVYEDIMKRAKRLDLINIYQCMSVSKNLLGEEWIDFDHVPKDLKFLSDDGKGLFNNKKTYELFLELKKRNLQIMIHEEDRELSPIDYRIAEDIHTIRDVYLSSKIGTRVHFCHVSTVDSLKAIKEGKKNNAPITLEVTPHHMILWDNDYRVNPPIRKKKDVDYIIECIKDGTVDCIATDHAPHTEEEKRNGAPGMIGLETAFPIVYKVLVENNQCDLSLVSKVMSDVPAKIMGLNKGRLEIGFDADLVVLNLDQKETVDTFYSKSSNSPFIGEKFTGVIEMTIVNGKIKYRREK